MFKYFLTIIFPGLIAALIAAILEWDFSKRHMLNVIIIAGMLSLVINYIYFLIGV